MVTWPSVSGAVPISDDTSALTSIVLLDASQIWVAQGDAEISITQQTSLVLDDSPSDAAAQLVSLWQHSLTGVRVVQPANWRVARSGAVQLISDVAY